MNGMEESSRPLLHQELHWFYQLIAEIEAEAGEEGKEALYGEEGRSGIGEEDKGETQNV